MRRRMFTAVAAVVAMSSASAQKIGDWFTFGDAAVGFAASPSGRSLSLRPLDGDANTFYFVLASPVPCESGDALEGVVYSTAIGSTAIPVTAMCKGKQPAEGGRSQWWRTISDGANMAKLAPMMATSKAIAIVLRTGWPEDVTVVSLDGFVDAAKKATKK